MAETPGLHYHPLSPNGDRQIRLLVLHPSAEASRPIRCSFTYTTLTSRPKEYEAISYAWGSGTLNHVVWSSTNDFSLPVTASAAAALRAVRLPREERVLWIDGLCINQTDDREKAQQVVIMGQIYGKATRTLVYLGEDEGGEFANLVYALATAHSVPDADDADFGVDADGEVISVHPIITATEKVGFDRKTATLDHVTAVAYWAREILYCSQDSFQPLIDFRTWFFARPWFSRLWMMQEVALSKRILFFFAGQELP